MTPSDDTNLHNFYSVLKKKLEVHRQTKRHLDRFLSTEFNVFKWIDPNENCLSHNIANLLNPACSHGQQRVFLDAFLRRIGKDNLCDKQPLQVTTEYPIENPKGRIDVLVDFGAFVIAIENKPWTKEGPKQLKKYSDYLSKQYNDQFCLIYLTLSRNEPNSILPDERKHLMKQGKLLCISYYTDILEWVRECCQLCESDKVRWFLRDFTNYIPTMEGSMSNSSERKIIIEHALENKENLENTVEVHRAYDDVYKRILGDFCEDLQICLKEHLDMSQWEFIREKDSFGFAKSTWDKKYKIGMQLYNETILLGVYRNEQNGELIRGLVQAIKDQMNRGQQGTNNNWWEYYFKLEPFGSKVLVEMQFNRNAIKKQVCKELVNISKISRAMNLIDEHVRVS